jgi:hypothetical protein
MSVDQWLVQGIEPAGMMTIKIGHTSFGQLIEAPSRLGDVAKFLETDGGAWLLPEIFDVRDVFE